MNSTVNFNKLSAHSFDPADYTAAAPAPTRPIAKLAHSDVAIELNADKTLLHNLEANDIKVHTQCRDGYCGSCRVKLVDGEVEYTTEPLACISADEILPCVCKAKSDLVIGV